MFSLASTQYQLGYSMVSFSKRVSEDRIVGCLESHATDKASSEVLILLLPSLEYAFGEVQSMWILF